MENKIIIATTNQGKIKEFNSFFEKNDLIDYIATISDFEMFNFNESGKSFYENAKLKAKYIAEKYNYKYPVLADDSGLCIEALDGQPGIYSARFNVNNDYSYKTKNNYFLKVLEDKINKRAYFYCCLVYIDENREMHVFDGRVDGLIKENKNKINYGFGYDPIFYHELTRKFFSDMDETEKNLFSHRGIALAKFVNFIKNKR